MGGGLSKGRYSTRSSNGSSSFTLRKVDSGSGELNSFSSRDDTLLDARPKVKHLFEKGNESDDDSSNFSTNESTREGSEPPQTLFKMLSEDEEMLKEVLSRFCYIESGLSTSTLDKVISSMELETIPLGQTLLRVGEMGDKLYVVNDGELSVTIGGRHIRTVRRKYVLGELAILYNEPRTATVVATTNCSVWSLKRDVFKRIQSKASSVIPLRRARNLINCPELACMPPVEMSRLSSAFRTHTFNDGEVLYSEGELTNRCILIEEGCAEILFSENNYNDVVKPLLEHGVPNDSVVDELIGVHRPPRKIAVSETITPPPISGSSRAVSGRASFSLMSTVPEDQEAPALSEKGVSPIKKVTSESSEVSKVAAASAVSDLRAFLISRVSWASTTKPQSRSISGGHVSAGCLLGMPVLRGKSLMPDCWRWYTRDELLQRGKDVAEGAKAPCTIIARGPVKAAVITAERFEAMFGPLSTLSNILTARTQSTSHSHSEKAGVPMLRKFQAQDFAFVGVLGKGAFGNVLLAECDEWETAPDNTSGKALNQCEPTTELDRRGRRQVAIKIMSKWEVVDLGFTRHVCDERRITAELSSMFVLKVYGTYQSPEMIALVTEALPSKDLWSVIHQKSNVQEMSKSGLTLSLSRFYCACLALAFSHIHEHGVAYRDVKPENIMIDEMGYVRIIDFGFAKKIPYTKVNLRGESKTHTKTFTLCGTPEYLAPEVVFNSGHDQMVDIWAMGITLYEMLFATTPFASSSPSGTFRKLAKVKRDGVNFSSEVMSKQPDASLWLLMSQLLNPVAADRQVLIGGCTRGLLDHPFFETIDFLRLGNKLIVPEYLPPIDAVNHTMIDCLPPPRPEKPFTGDETKFAEF